MVKKHNDKMFKKKIQLNFIVLFALIISFNATVKATEASDDKIKMAEAIFAARFFYNNNVAKRFRTLKGVVLVDDTYCGGDYPDPDFGNGNPGTSSHAESLEIKYNPQLISYNELLKIFWSSHDPTTSNRQHPNFATQYHSIIFYTNKTQKKLAIEAKLKLAKKFKRPIITEILPVNDYNHFEEEAYRQKYLLKHGYKF